mgnify:CR=1 FL=1
MKTVPDTRHRRHCGGSWFSLYPNLLSATDASCGPPEENFRSAGFRTFRPHRGDRRQETP